MEKLWQKLFDDGLYTKSFEEFQKQFSGEKNQQLLHSKLNKDELYSKSFDDFKTQFFGGKQIGPAKEKAAVGSNQNGTAFKSGDGSSASQDDTAQSKVARAIRSIDNISITQEEKDEIALEADNDVVTDGSSFTDKLVGLLPGMSHIATNKVTVKKGLDDYIDKAKKEISTDPKTNYTEYDVPEEEYIPRARELFIEENTKKLYEEKVEEHLEEYEKDVYGGIFSLRRLKKIASPIAGTGKTDEDLEYVSGRGAIAAKYKEEQKGAEKEYKEVMESITTHRSIIDSTHSRLESMQRMFQDDPTFKTDKNIKLFNSLLNTYKTAAEVYSNQFDRLSSLQSKSGDAAGLADLTVRTYNNLDIASNRLAGAGMNIVAGLGSFAKELSYSQMIKRFTGVDFAAPNAFVPAYARLFDKAVSSDSFGEGLVDLYSAVDELDSVTKKRQELGEIKSIEDFLEFMLDLTSEQAANTALTVGTGGAGLLALSASAAGNKFHEMDMELAAFPDKKISPWQFYTAGVLYGAAEYVTEKVSLGQAKRALNYMGFAKNNFKKAYNITEGYTLDNFKLSKSIRDWGINTNKEGGAEFAAQLMNNFTDKYILDKDVSLTQGLREAYVTGALMSGLGFQAPILAGDIAKAFTGGGDQAKLNKMSKELFEIRKEINSIQTKSNFSDDPAIASSISMLQERAESIIENKLSFLKEAASRIDALGNNDKGILLEIEAEVFRLKHGIDKANKNGKITAGSKLNLINNFKNRIDRLNANKEDVLNNAQYSKEIEQQKNLQLEIAEKNGKLGSFEAVNVDTKEEAISKIKEKIAKSDISDSQRESLEGDVADLKNRNLNGWYMGAEAGIPMVVSVKSDALKNKAGAVIAHETGHATVLKALLENNADMIGLANSLEKFVVSNFKGLSGEFSKIEKIYKAAEMGKVAIAEEKMARALEIIRQKNLRAGRTLYGELRAGWNKIKPGSSTDVSSIETGEDVFNLLESFSRSLDKGKFEGMAKRIMEGKIEVKQAESPQESKGTKLSQAENIQNKINQLEDSYDNGELDYDDYEQQLGNLEEHLKRAKAKEKVVEKKPVSKKPQGDKEASVNKKKLGDSIDKLVPKGTTKKEYDSKIISAIADKLVVSDMLNPLIKRIAARYGIVADNVYGQSWDTFFEAVKGVQFIKNLQKFNPEANNSLGGFIIGSNYGIKNRVKEAIAKFKKEGEGGFKQDVSTAKGIAAEESSTAVAEKPKYKSLVDSKVAPPEAIDKIKKSMLRVVRTLKSKMNAEVSINKTVTPLVNEIKTEMGKQADIYIKKVMGGKGGGKLRGFLLGNKRAILENMTTTWLTRAMPGAVQKRVDGKWTSDWAGKKIDRESVNTDNAGRTSGAEMVRRLPNAHSSLSDADFLGYVINEDGSPIRGRKESVAKAIAEELSFEILSNELKDENSPLREAFEKNQEALGVVLENNFTQEIGKQIERGNIKYALGAGEIAVIEQTSAITAADTATERSIEIAKLKKLMAKGDFEKAVELIIHPHEENLREIKEKGWKAAEQAAINSIIELAKEIPGLKVLQRKLQKNSSKPDLIFKYKDIEVAWEVKAGKTARLGKFFLKGQGKNNKITKNISKWYKDEITKRDLENESVQDLYSELEKLLKSEEVSITAGGNYRIDHDVFYDKIAKLLSGTDTRDLILDTGIVKEYYANKEKPVNYLSYSDLGDFSLGGNPLGLDIADFAGKVFMRQKFDQRWYNRKKENKKTYVILMRSATPTLTNDSAKKLQSKSSIFVSKSFQKALESRTGKSNKRYSLSEELNNMIERKKGIPSDKVISRSRASNLGKGQGWWDVFISPNTEDFAGLMYKFYGKGKQGDKDMAFIKKHILDPYERGEIAISRYKQKLSNQFKELRRKTGKLSNAISPETKKALEKAGFTSDQAVRVFIWNKLGYKIPNITDKEVNTLVDIVSKEQVLKDYIAGLLGIARTQQKYPKPTHEWYANDVAYDIYMHGTEGSRSELLQEWISNVDEMFSEENLNKIEAAYGTNYVKNLKELIDKMKTGRTRAKNLSKEEKAILDYTNGAVGVTMWLNMRSAVLQTISSINFINWGDNNPLKAGQAMLNPKKFVSTFMEIMNSDFLKQRREGLEINVEEAEIAHALASSKNKLKSIYSSLIKFGFKPTQIADSFAIAAGGTSFYINRTKTYVRQGMELADAKAKAFADFRSLAEEHQQSSRPDRVSNIQGSLLGRLIFAYANTPLQMTRLSKKAVLDLAYRRGDVKTNVSKLVYYTAIQSAIFYSLQQAAIFELFKGDDEEEEMSEKKQAFEKEKRDKKIDRLLNGMLDGYLSGTGLTGKIIVMAKNTIAKYLEEDKKGYNADAGKVINEMLSLSPTLSSKTKAILSTLNTEKYYKTKRGKKELELAKGIKPTYISRAKTVSSLTNLPAHRILQKLDNLNTAFTDEEIGIGTKGALALGWDKWSLGFYDKEFEEEEKKKKGGINKEAEKKREEKWAKLSPFDRAKERRKWNERKKKRDKKNADKNK